MFRSMIHFAKDITGILIQSALNLWVTLGNNIFVTRLNLPIRKCGMSFLLHCCCCSVAKPCLTLCDPMDWAPQASLSFIISWSLLRLTSIELVMPSNHLILCCPLLLMPSIPPSNRVFYNESAFPIRWPKFWSFSISHSNKYSGLISFRIDCFDFLAVQVTLKSFPAPQFKIINSSVLSLLYGPTITFVHDYWKNHSFDYMDLCQ